MSGNQGEEDPSTLVDSDNYSRTPAGEENVPALLEESGKEDLTFHKGMFILLILGGLLLASYIGWQEFLDCLLVQAWRPRDS